LPLFSDDRVIRILAREAGIPSFGTIAITEALTRRGLLTDDAKDRARAALAAAGAIDLSTE
jgi:hypothetical protein